MTELIRTEWREWVRAHALPWDQPATERVWAPRLECLSRDELVAHQGERVRRAYRYLWHTSAFYRRRFEQAGLGPDSVKTVDDLTLVPPTHREEWLVDQEQNPPWGSFSALRDEDWQSRGWMLFTTSGTTAASPRVFRHTTHDRDLWTWHGARALYAMGVRKGDVAINCFGYGTSVAFWGLHYALNHMGVPVISGGGSNTQRRAMFIQKYRPTVLLCTPSYASYLGRAMQEAGEDPAASSIRLLVCAGEPGPAVPATKARLEALWGAKINDDFGCTEVAMSPFGYTCQEQVARADGQVDVHLMEDAYVPELLDPVTHQRVPVGQRGVMVVSNLFSESMPVLRYVMGDWATLTTDTCACGRTHARVVGGLQGRADQLVKIRGLLFFPSALEDAVRRLPGTGDEFQIEVVREDGLDRVRATLELDRGLDPSEIGARTPELERALRGALGIEVQVTLTAYGTLPRTEFKAKRLFDRRPKGTQDA